MKPVILIPTYNERDSLPVLIEKIRATAPAAHVLIIDDNSPDGTGQLADQIGASSDGAVSVLHRTRKEGLGRAYRQGFRQVLKGDYDVIVQMDGDLSHDPDSLPLFLEKIGGCDLVVGSRYLKGISVVNWDLKRLILSRLANRYVQVVTGMPLKDATSGFKCWRRDALDAIGWEETISNGYVFQVEMKYRAYRNGFRIIEVPITFTERKQGESKLNWSIIREALTGVLRLRFNRRRRKTRPEPA